MAITLTLPAILGLVVFQAGLGLFFWRVLGRARHLEREAETFRTVAQRAGDGLLLQAEDSRILWANDAYSEMMGYPQEDLIGRYPLEFVLPADLRPDTEAARAFRFDPESEDFRTLKTIRNVRADGEEFINQLRVAAVVPSNDDEGAGLKVVTSCRDVTESVRREAALKRAHEEIKRQATRDSLTGIANRSVLTRALEAKRESGEPFALLSIDLDDFKLLNDSYGHPAGDAALRRTGRVLAAAAGPDWCIGRVGGDEFLVIVPGITEMLAAARIAIGITRDLRQPFLDRGRRLPLSASIGVAIADGPANDAEDLLQQADVALYAAKRRSRTKVACYDATMHARHEMDRMLRSALETAVTEGEIGFHLQATLDVGAREIRGFELLARWHHPVLGDIDPGTMLPLIEDMGLMRAFDRHAATTALRIWRHFADLGHPDVRIGFNAAPASLNSSEFATMLQFEADRTGVPPDRIVIEVLETTFFSRDHGTDKAACEIDRLREAGFEVLLDDFGVGFAGLSHLAGLSVSGLKIDRSLIVDIEEGGTGTMIVRAILSLCRDLGFRVVAEGIETAGQLEALDRLGCEVGQGFGIARPVPLEEAVALLKAGPLFDTGGEGNDGTRATGTG